MIIYCNALMYNVFILLLYEVRLIWSINIATEGNNLPHYHGT